MFPIECSTASFLQRLFGSSALHRKVEQIAMVIASFRLWSLLRGAKELSIEFFYQRTAYNSDM